MADDEDNTDLRESPPATPGEQEEPGASVSAGGVNGLQPDEAELVEEIQAAGDVDLETGVETILDDQDARGASHLRSAEATTLFVSDELIDDDETNGNGEPDPWFNSRLTWVQKEIVDPKSGQSEAVDPSGSLPKRI